MTEKNFFYNTIQQDAVAEYKDKGSKFLAYIFPIHNTQDFKSRLSTLKKEHPKAAHHCFAYRLGIDENNFRSSDNGEPAGTAGRPILGQIDSKELTDTAIVVVRYFGGTMLGVPGLINAYKTAAALALQLTPIIQKAIMRRCIIEFEYSQMNEIQRRLKSFQSIVVQQELQLFCHIIVDIPVINFKEALNVFTEMKGVDFSIASKNN